MDGVLVIDKPQGLTSHDVVAAARRAIGDSRVGHTGTLDPLATGVLPLAVGQATRLVRFLTASDKDYVATIRFGMTTDSYDITGTETGRTDAVPPLNAITEAVRQLTGEYLQMPPAFSAKKVDGRRAYRLAREDRPVALTAVPVRVSRAEVVSADGPCAIVTLTCSAGFYVRSFAYSLGELTGSGACLEALRRTRSGEFDAGVALPMDRLQDPASVGGSLIPLERVLHRFPAVTLTDRGRGYVSHGRELDPADLSGPVTAAEWTRLFDSTGSLVALATPGRAPGSLHPSVVLI
jgi:tRNA pseudouridine55 synthase